MVLKTRENPESLQFIISSFTIHTVKSQRVSEYLLIISNFRVTRIQVFRFWALCETSQTPSPFTVLHLYFQIGALKEHGLMKSTYLGFKHLASAFPSLVGVFATLALVYENFPRPRTGNGLCCRFPSTGKENTIPHLSTIEQGNIGNNSIKNQLI